MIVNLFILHVITFYLLIIDYLIIITVIID